MNKINRKQLFFSTGLVCLIAIAIAFSCDENASDESPKQINSTLGNNGKENSSLSIAGTEIKIRSIGQKIPDETAKRWIGNRAQKNPNGIKYYLFGKETFERLLNQPNAAGIRLCNAYDDSGNPIIVMVAVDDKNSVLDGLTQEGYDDASHACPPICGTDEN